MERKEKEAEILHNLEFTIPLTSVNIIKVIKQWLCKMHGKMREAYKYLVGKV